MHMETRNSKTEMPLFKVKGEKFIFVGEKTIMKLSDMCIMFGDGDWIESKDQSDDGIRLLQTGNIGEGKFLEKGGKERFISRETFEKLKCKEVFSGDILISRLPEPVGRACLVPEKKQRMITAVDCTICRIDDKKIRRRYLCYYLQSANYYTQLKNSITGTTRKRISRKNLGNIEIKIPSDKKQEEVIKQLDLIVEIIDNKKKKLQLLDTLVKSRFVEMFGDSKINPNNYPICQLSEYINFLTSGSRGWAKYCIDSGREWFITIKNVKDCNISVDNMQSINAPDNAEAKRTKVQEGDLLISITADLGRTGVITKEIAEHGAYINQHLTRICLNQAILNPLYVAYFMETPAGKEQFESKNQSAVKAGLNFNSINSLKIMIPPMDVQNKFVAFVNQVNKSK